MKRNGAKYPANTKKPDNVINKNAKFSFNKLIFPISFNMLIDKVKQFLAHDDSERSSSLLATLIKLPLNVWTFCGLSIFETLIKRLDDFW